LGDYQRALEHGRDALQLRQQHGLVSHLLYYRPALAAFHLDDETQALQLLAAALEETELSPYTFQFRLVAGECYTRLGRWEEAADALQMALALAQKGGNPLAVATAQRAQADLALAQGDTAAALGHVEGLLPLLAGAPLPSSYEPLRLYWTGYRALQANCDPRAPTILSAAYALLQSQAALIRDAALRHTFLHQVAANREICQTSEVSETSEV
jgi:tetratricopeptide (TPR) repeat protein